MDDKLRAAAYAECEKEGIDWAKAAVSTMTPGQRPVFVQQWINEQVRKEDLARQIEQTRLANEAIAAAKDASKTAADAADAARTSAKWTMWAAVGAFTGVVVTIAQGYGWLPKA